MFYATTPGAGTLTVIDSTVTAMLEGTSVSSWMSTWVNEKEISLESTIIPRLPEHTTDDSHPLVWTMLTFLSGGAVLTLTLKGKRKTNQ